jgi:hypothetical protein
MGNRPLVDKPIQPARSPNPGHSAQQLTRRGFGYDRSLKRCRLIPFIGGTISIDHTGLKNLKKMAVRGL